MQTVEHLLEAISQLTVQGIGISPHFREIAVRVPATVRDDKLIVSAEESDSYCWLDYYGEFRGGSPWIHPELMNFAESYGGFWEWNHAGSITFYFI